MILKDKFARCELCYKYCGDKKHKVRLFVELPSYLQERLNKSHAYLCFGCVREHCKDTIGNIKYDGCTPMRDDNGNIMRTTYWKDIIFKGKMKQTDEKTIYRFSDNYINDIKEIIELIKEIVDLVTPHEEVAMYFLDNYYDYLIKQRDELEIEISGEDEENELIMADE